MSNKEMESHAKTETLWSVLSKYSIIIPRMQRDYAQGRATLAAKRIRTEFVKEIFDTLKSFAEGNTERPLDLNFVYGNVNDEMEFFPIDGQQRLTTLFLLYWYLASYNAKGQLSSETKRILSGFKYQSREVSESFCSHLVEDVSIDVTKNISLTESIKDYYWFYGDFETDPTICSMLVMLEKIDETAKEYSAHSNVAAFLDLLTNDPLHSAIRFLFLDLNDVGMTDSIYIKMNARGKPLTPFENFKAQLLTYLNKYEPHFGDDFIDKVNGEWSNLFWKCSDERIDGRIIKSAEKMDECMMRFFRFMMQIEFITNAVDSIAKMDGTKDLNVRRVYTKLEQEDIYSFVDHLFADEFRTVDVFRSNTPIVSGDLFKRIAKLLNVINHEIGTKEKIDFSFLDSKEFGKEYICESDMFLRMIGAANEKKFTATDSIKLAAEFVFLIKYADNITYCFEKKKELNRWMRYIHNLAANTENSSKEHYCYCINNTCKKIDELDEKAENVLERIAQDELIAGDNSGFQKEQALEEKVKAQLLIDDYSLWAGLLSDAENTKLDGEIQCLLSFSEDDSKRYSSERFALYLKKMRALFGDDLSNEISGRVLRALLSVNLASNNTQNSFLFTKKTNYNFWSNSIDGINTDSDFRRFLRNDNDQKRITLKNLLDQLPDTITEARIEKALDGIISTNMKVASKLPHDKRYAWMCILVNDPDILDSIEPNGIKDAYGFVFKTPCRYIRTREITDPSDPNKSFETIYLLERTVWNSNHRELFTYELYLEAKRNNLDVSYHVESATDINNYLEYTDNKGRTIRVTYEWYSNGDVAYLARDWSRTGNDITPKGSKDYMGETLKKAINYIENNIHA